MDSNLAKTIQEALKSEFPRPDTENHGNVIQHPPIHAAIGAIKSETGLTRQQIVWRALRLYFYAYLNSKMQSSS